MKQNFLFRGVTHELEDESKIADVVLADKNEFDSAVVHPVADAEITLDNDNVIVQMGTPKIVKVTSAHTNCTVTSKDTKVTASITGKNITLNGTAPVTNAKVEVKSGSKTKEITVKVEATVADPLETTAITLDKAKVEIGKTATDKVKITSAHASSLTIVKDGTFTDYDATISGKEITIKGKGTAGVGKVIVKYKGDKQSKDFSVKINNA